MTPPFICTRTIVIDGFVTFTVWSRGNDQRRRAGRADITSSEHLNRSDLLRRCFRSLLTGSTRFELGMKRPQKIKFSPSS